MQYKYALKENYEDFACGRVIYHRTGAPTFPVRLASEIFSRCLEYSTKKDHLVVYDPCCGGGYTLTVLGLLFSNHISTIIGSDINPDVLSLAEDNLSLLTLKGLNKRQEQIKEMIGQYNKESHYESLKSINRFFHINNNRTNNLSTQCFISDILDVHSLKNKEFIADIVFADVPYGNLVSWSNSSNNQLTILLDTIVPIINHDTIIAISSDKNQKISSEKYKRLERFKIGKRKIEIMRLKEDLINEF